MSKRLRIILLVILAPIVLAAMAIVWLCYTASGLQFALEQLNHVPNLTLQVAGVTGKLAGPLHVDHLLMDHERARIEVDNLDVDLTPALLMSGLVSIDELHIGNAQVQYKPNVENQPDKPIHFLPAFLRVRVATLQLDHAEYRHSSGYTLIVNALRSSISMSRNRLRATELDAQTTDFDARGTVTLTGGGTLKLSAKLDGAYRVAGGATGQVVLRGAAELQGALTGAKRELQLQGQLREPHVATTTGVLTFTDTGWLLQGSAQAEQVKLDPWWADPTFSVQQLTMNYRLNEAGMHYDGDANVPEWSPARLHFDTDQRYAQRVLTIERAVLTVPQSGVNANAAGTIALQEQGPLLDIHGNWTVLRWPLHATSQQAVFNSTQGQFTLKGTQPYQFSVEADVSRADFPASHVRANGELRPGEIELARYELQNSSGYAMGSALVGYQTPYRWRFTIDGQHLNPAQWLSQWPGDLNIKAQAQGVGIDQQAQFDATVQTLSGTLRQQAISGSGRVQRQQKNWQADALQLKWGTTELTAQGVIGQRNDLRFTLKAPQLQALQLGVAGDVQASGEFAGNADTLWLQLQAQSKQLRYGDWQSQIIDLTAKLDVSANTDSSLQLNAQRISHGELALQSVVLNGTGQASSHQLSLQASPVATMLPEDLQMQVQIQGQYAERQWQGVLQQWQVVDAEQRTRLQLEQPINLLVSAEQLQTQSLCVTLDGGRACAQANAQQTPTGLVWQAQANLQDLPVTISNKAFAEGARIDAKLGANVDLSQAAGQPWLGTATLQTSDASIRYELSGSREQILPISLGELRMTADAEQVQFNGEVRVAQTTVSSLDAKLERRGDEVGAWPLSGVWSLSSSDAKLIPVFVEDVDRADGTLAGIVQMAGTVAQPRVNGIVRLLNGELDFYQLNLALRQFAFDATLSSEQISFTAQADAGKGQLQSQGQFTWQDAQGNSQFSGKFTLKGERLLVADLPEYRVLASPDLSFDIADKTVQVSGEVVIPEATLQPKEVVGAVQASSDARYISTDEDKVIAQQDSNWTINSNVTIRLGDAVNFDGLGLQGRLTGAVATHIKSGDAAVGDGELSVLNGRYEAYAQKLDIKRGRLIYDNTALGNPGLDIQAERTINEITVGLYVRGVLREPRLQFYSDPSMTQTQIVSYLLVGKPLDELQGSEATTVRSASNTLAIQGGGYLAAQLGRRIGLEEVGVETDSDNQSSLVLGKFLSPRLFVSYGISLTEAINTVKLRYTLSDHWLIKTEAGDAKSADIEFKIDH